MNKKIAVAGSGYVGLSLAVLPTSYDNFRQYYFNHILEITKELTIKK